jgi:hypothetical protein
MTLVNVSGHGPIAIRLNMSSWLDQSPAIGCDFLFAGGGLGSEGPVGGGGGVRDPRISSAVDWQRRLGNLVLES